jgi:hypothetical protein
MGLFSRNVDSNGEHRRIMRDMRKAPGLLDFLNGSPFAYMDSGNRKDDSFGGYGRSLDKQDLERLRVLLVRRPGQSDFTQVGRDGFADFIREARATGEPIRSVTYGGNTSGREGIGDTANVYVFQEQAGGGVTQRRGLHHYEGTNSYSATYAYGAYDDKLAFPASRLTEVVQDASRAITPEWPGKAPQVNLGASVAPEPEAPAGRAH